MTLREWLGDEPFDRLLAADVKVNPPDDFPPVPEEFAEGMRARMEEEIRRAFDSLDEAEAV